MNRRPRAAARRLLPIFQEVLAPVEAEAARVASCRRGCSSCCFKLATITLAEGTLLAERVLASSRSGELRRILQQQATSIATLTGDVATAHLVARVPCAFLDATSGDCTVYDARPATCRTMFVVSPPERCSPELADGVVAYVNLQDKLVEAWKASFIETKDSIPAALGFLPEMVLAGIELLTRSPRDFKRYAQGRRIGQALLNAATNELTAKLATGAGWLGGNANVAERGA